MWFSLLSILAFCGEALGYAACTVLATTPPHPLALATLAGVALLVGGMGAVLLNWLLLDRSRHIAGEMADLRSSTVPRTEIDEQATTRLEQQRRLRHDLRGALSPALLVADRLIVHADPRVKRAGEIMVQAVERASSLLTEPESLSPLGDP